MARLLFIGERFVGALGLDWSAVAKSHDAVLLGEPPRHSRATFELTRQLRAEVESRIGAFGLSISAPEGLGLLSLTGDCLAPFLPHGAAMVVSRGEDVTPGAVVSFGVRGLIPLFCKVYVGRIGEAFLFHQANPETFLAVHRLDVDELLVARGLLDRDGAMVPIPEMPEPAELGEAFEEVARVTDCAPRSPRRPLRFAELAAA